MPYSPKRPCRYPGCPNLCETGCYCEEHRKQYSPESQRGNSSERGYGSKWRAERARFLRHNPLCAECLRHGRVTPATVVDHIIPHRGDMTLFWDQNNWQPLCKQCHDKKTGREM